ncbi:neuronal-specific septin-3 isoform X2 [Panthera tigris]|uniref:neuronal-specific septin-3 isoform X2 n=1 Tax=Panthera tigris TaxID=9694 RepID=UPI001C6FA871|nr:neuronal-specific septin-3 isoform X2 [Panthera tigris]
MQQHGAPSPGDSLSRSHLLGRPGRSSKLPGGVSPLIPVLRKTIHLDAFPQSHIPQASSRPGPGAGAWSVSSPETKPRKLSSTSLTLRQNSQAWPLGPLPSHWEELPAPGREAATHGGGRLPTPASRSVSLVPGGRVHSEGPGNPGLAKPSRMPIVEKPLVSSYLALPFQSRLAQKSPGPAGPGPVGQKHPLPVAAHVTTRTSPGRGKPRSRGIPRPQLHLQRATSTMGPATAMDLAPLDTTRPGIVRHVTTMVTDKPSLTINLAAPSTSTVDTGTEFPALDTKLGTAADFATEGTTKLGTVMDLVTPDPEKLGKAIATAGTAKSDTTTGGAAMDLVVPGAVKLGTTRTDTAMALARANTAKLDITTDSFALDTSKLGTATGETTLDRVINLTISATYPLMPSRSTDPAPDRATADAVTDGTTEPIMLDLARETKGLPEARTDAAMSELVPEPRPKPAVPMKPVSINSNLLGYIGIDTIIEQMRKKTMKTGFDFNIMVVGQSGLGKSTLVNTLFKSQVSRKASSWNREEKIPKTVEIKAIGHVIEEGGVKMKLTVIDTPGFGDQINNENCWEPIEKYINEQYEKFLKEEVNIARKKRIPDTRVHCCLYFISPTGHSLRPLDLEFMKHLSKVVNIIPVIAKADTMTLEEKSEFKQRVRKELEVNGIEFYPQKEFDEDLEDKTENDKIRESMPFAVVGSDKEYQVNGKRVLGRKTPWGIIEVENLNHCEFALLRDFVIRTHLQDLKEVTHNIHYETYRAKRLNDNGGLPPVLGKHRPRFGGPGERVERSSRQHCPPPSSVSAGPSPSVG